MLSVEVRVNKELIGCAHIRNTGMGKGEKDKYHVSYYMPNRRSERLEFDVLHDPRKGAEVLVSIVY